MAHSSIPAELANLAENIVNTLTETAYVFDDGLDADAGVWKCDCSIFAGHLLRSVDQAHFDDIPQVEANRYWPRAFEYYNFFSGLATESSPRWKPVSKLAHARRGDLLAWSTGVLEAGRDTGHVVLLAETPVRDEDGNFRVGVYDSSAKAHFDDTRGLDETFHDGVGFGYITFEVNRRGRTHQLPLLSRCAGLRVSSHCDCQGGARVKGADGPQTISRIWRKRRDSNPRYLFRYASFQDWSHQPLGHSSLSPV